MRLFFTMIELLVAVFNTHALEHMFLNSVEESYSCSESSEEKTPENVSINPSLKLQLQLEENIGCTEEAEAPRTSEKPQVPLSEDIVSTEKAEEAEELKSSESNAASEESVFPYLNFTSITMLDENNQPVEGFFTHPSSGRSAADVEKTMSVIAYIVYNREEPNGTAVKYADELKATKFHPEKPVKLITHGWLSSGSADTCLNIKDGYLNTTDVNVIVMDWREIANDYYYINPMRAVPKVAHHYAIFINDMINNLKVEPKNIHLIGHSLGAHVSGLVWKDMEGKKPERVTGLDPAFPGFDHIFMFNERISNESGVFVDIIHSCGGLLGILDPLGHADFYPNGGTAAQPGCFNLLEACSHGRSWQFFADSVQYPKRKFLATRCDSWDQFVSNKCDDSENIIMGEFAQHTARGKYFLRTNPAKPFSKYEIN